MNQNNLVEQYCEADKELDRLASDILRKEKIYGTDYLGFYASTDRVISNLHDEFPPRIIIKKLRAKQKTLVKMVLEAIKVKGVFI